MKALVYTVERQKDLFDFSKKKFREMGLYPKFQSFGDGFAGLPTFAPFDKIIVTCGAAVLPTELLKQLKVGGKMVIPLGPTDEQVLYRFTKVSPTEFEKEEFDDYEEDEYDRIDAEDINIDEYLSDDETPDYKLQANNYSDDDDDRETPFAAQTSFHQDLINQLNTFILSDDDRGIAEFLVGSIDDDGYLRRSIQDIVDDMAFTQGIYTDEKAVERILNIIHDLEPAGVGARDLQECLLLQLKHKTPTEYVDLAITVIENHFEQFTKKHYEKLLTSCNVSQEQLKKAIEEIEKLTAAKRPVLVGTTSVEISQLLSKALQLRKIPHQVLNAKLHKKEAEIVAGAGGPGVVTIATNMAGRGTDIKLKAEVKDAGGLAIIGTERHDSRRVDRQLRGRAGRQGDPGSSQFYVSLEDNLMRLFGSERIAKMMDRMGHKEGEVIQKNIDWNKSNGTYEFAYALGSVIFIIGLLTVLGIWFPKIGLWGGLLTFAMSLVTLSFLITLCATSIIPFAGILTPSGLVTNSTINFTD